MTEKKRRKKYPLKGYSIRINERLIEMFRDLQRYSAIPLNKLYDMAFEKMGYLERTHVINLFEELDKPEEKRRFKEWQAKKQMEKDNE